MRLRRKKALKIWSACCGGKPRSGIADAHHNLFVFRSLRLDGELARPIYTFIASMLLVMRFIMTCCNCTRSPMTGGRSAANSARTDMECRVTLAAQEDNHLSNYFVYINGLPLRRTLLEELADPTDDFGRTLCVFHDTQRRRARLFEIRVGASEPAQAGFGVGGCRRQIGWVTSCAREAVSSPMVVTG